MRPAVFQALNTPAIRAHVGTSPVRIFGAAIAPQGTARPYIVWQIVGGGPVNTLSCDPTTDNLRVRVSVYCDEAEGTAAAATLAELVRNALEVVTHVVMGPFDDFEVETRLIRWTMDAEFWDNRA